VADPGTVEFSEREVDRVRWKTALAVGLMVAGAVAGSLVGLLGPQTSLDGRAHGIPQTDAQEAGGILGLVATWAMLGTLFLGWAWTGVPVMLRWRAHRVDVHNWVSLGVLALALFHTFEFTLFGDLRGWLSGWLSNLLLFALFATGWWRAYWVRRWGRGTWRVVHWELALGALALAFLHWLLVEHGKEALGIPEGF
jgi:hypothetical protein